MGYSGTLTYYDSIGGGGILGKNDSNGGSPIVQDARYSHLIAETPADFISKLDQLLHPATENEAIDTEPVSFTLLPNWPNPFNPITTFAFVLPEAGDVHATVYNMLGARVDEPVKSNLPAGYHEFQFDGRDFASGVYFLNVEWEGVIRNQKMLLVK